MFKRLGPPLVDHTFHAGDHFRKLDILRQLQIKPIHKPSVSGERLRGPIQQWPIHGVAYARHDKHMLAGFSVLHAVLTPWGDRWCDVFRCWLRAVLAHAVFDSPFRVFRPSWPVVVAGIVSHIAC